MKLLYKFAFFIIVNFTLFSSFSQPIDIAPADSAETKKIKIRTTPILVVYTNFHAIFGNKVGGKDIAFALDRSYLGYKIDFTPDLFAKVVLDVGYPTKEERLALIKYALLHWQRKKISIEAGMIDMSQISLQVNYWRYPYLMKSHQDEHKFGYCADLGISAKYQLAPWVAVDLFVANGEGYKEVSFDNRFRYGGGVTFTPVEGLNIRGYYDRADKKIDDTLGKAQENVSFFIGYRNSYFSIATEFNNLFNGGNVSAWHRHGFSVYGYVALPKNLELLFRWDMIFTGAVSLQPNDGCLTLIGLQYSPIRYVQITPNFRLWTPLLNQSPTWYGYLSMQFKL